MVLQSMITKEQYGENFTKWDQKFKAHSVEGKIPWQWMKSICMVESALGTNPRVAIGLSNPEDVDGSRSEDGKSWGLMQMTLPAARDFDPLVTPQKLNFPDYSIMLSSMLLRRLNRIFGGIEEWVVKAYNQGAGATRLEKERGVGGNADDYWKKYQEHKAIL